MLKKAISAILSALFILSAAAGMALSAAADESVAQLDALFVNKNTYDPGFTNYRDTQSITVTAGDHIYILGWIKFSSTDGLKEIKYSVNGKEYACEDVYRDRADVAGAYANGKHAGYGLDEHMMELTGIDALGKGTYTLSLKAYSNGGSVMLFKTYSLTVKNEATVQLDRVQQGSDKLGQAEDLRGRERITLRQGTDLYIAGWIAYPGEDKLNRVVYTVDGTQYACDDNYYNRSDIAKIGVSVYNNGEHAGFGSNEKMFCLTGISKLTYGVYEVKVTGISDKNKTAEICSFTLRVTALDKAEAVAPKGDVNGDGGINNKDVITLFKYVSGNVKDVNKPEADVNSDGRVDNKDVIALFRYVSTGTNPDDTYAGTPAYTVNGDTVTVNGVSYPNTNEMKYGVTAAMDDLGRSVLTDGGTYSSDGGKNVGLFYFLWLGEHGDSGIFDITKILEKGGSAAKSASYSGWGPVGAMHFWGEPLYGYYYSRDKWVMRKHVEELTLAGVDFLYIDATNGFPYISNSLQLMSIMHEFNEQGYTAPKIVFYTHSSCSATVNTIYNSIYRANKYPDTWFKLDGKPLIIAYEDECKSKLNSNAYNTFTFREPQWPNERQKTNGWPWMDFNYPQRVFVNKKGQNEAISVSVAQHSGTVQFSDSAIYGNTTNRGRSFRNGAAVTTPDATLYGYNFAEQFERAIAADVPFILVTGWNEWVAQRQDPGSSNRVRFVDTSSMEYSRDLEPMKGGYFDNYYMLLVEYIRRYKGTAPTLIQNTRKHINISGSFDQWNSVLVEYKDPKGDTENRNSRSFGNKTLTDSTGNNDIVSSKIVYDTKYVYFYAETAANITAPASGSSWMQLFLDADQDQYTGFYGFDYIVNYKSKGNGKTTLARIERSGDTYKVLSETTVDYKVTGNKLMIRVPLEEIGIYNYNDIMLSFKWADSKTQVKTMEQMYTDGDIAPLGRLCFTFQNHN